MYISRREMYNISAVNVHLPPRFITSCASRKTCEACSKTSAEARNVLKVRLDVFHRECLKTERLQDWLVGYLDIGCRH